MTDHTDHTLAIGGCADCDRVATEIGYALMGIPAGGKGRVEARARRIYQFEFRHPRTTIGGADLVVDIAADSPEAAVEDMRQLAEGWASDDDPTTITVVDGAGNDDATVYARVWINIPKPERITTEQIIEQWDEEEVSTET